MSKPQYKRNLIIIAITYYLIIPNPIITVSEGNT